MGFIVIDFIIALIVLIAIDAPWWAWVIYAVSAVVWFMIWVLSDGGTNKKTADITRQDQSCTED